MVYEICRTYEYARSRGCDCPFDHFTNVVGSRALLARGRRGGVAPTGCGPGRHGREKSEKAPPGESGVSHCLILLFAERSHVNHARLGSAWKRTELSSNASSQERGCRWQVSELTVERLDGVDQRLSGVARYAPTRLKARRVRLHDDE